MWYYIVEDKIKKKKGGKKMEALVVVAIALAIPVILFPVAFVWYLNVGALYTAYKAARVAKKAKVQAIKEVIQ
jgi:hypothetical protein